MKKHLYRWIPDIPDFRDYQLQAVKPNLFVAPLPASVDLRPQMSPVEDQGQLGSCTANALVGAVEFLENKLKIDLTRGKFADLSRLFVYYNERVLEGSTPWDAGAMLRDGVKTLAHQGVCTETIWPYNIRRFAIRPSNAAYADARNKKISVYARVPQTIAGMKACLAGGFPFVFGLTVYSSFESLEVEQTGVVPMPGHNESFLGGHAMLCVGYSDVTQRVICRNSWGSSWGMSGYCTMPYDYMTNPNLVADIWTIDR